MTDRIADILIRDHDLAREACHKIATAYERFHAIPAHGYRGNRNLNFLRSFISDEHLKFVSDVAHDILIESITGDSHVAGINETTQTHNADVRRPAADIYDHAPR